MKLLIILLLAAAVLPAQSRTSIIHRTSTSMFEDSLDGVIAQFVDGGAWQTTITLVNLDTTVCTYTIKFFSNGGTALAFQTSDGTAATLTGTIPVGGSHRIASLGTSPVEFEGWVLVSVSNTTGGSATFKQRVPGRLDFVASMPIMFYLDGNDYVVPFDNLNSATGIGLVNPLSFETITVFFTFRDESGNRFFLDSLSLGPMQHTSLDLATRFPPAAGLRGTVEIATTGIAVNVLALSFLGGAFSSVLPLEVPNH